MAAAPEANALIVPEGVTWTWRRVAQEVAAVQRGLGALGVAPGARVAVICDNSERTHAALAAIVGMAAVAVPVNTGLVGAGLAHVLSDSGARVVIADPVYITRCAELMATGSVPRMHCVSTAEEGPGEPWLARFAVDPAAPLLALGKGSDPAMILYTSGTTGRSKGAQISHACVLAAIEASATVMFEATPEDVLYTCLPLFHCAGQRLGMWTALRAGACLVLARGFSARGFWDQLRDHGVTKFHFLGPLLSILWKAPPTPRDRDQPARLAVAGGPRLAWREFEDRFDLTFVETYGMTETFGGCVSHTPRDGRAGSVGYAMAHVETAVMDEAGNIVLPGTAGEICIRPRWRDVMFSGYHGRPDLTAAAWRDGWFRTGDAGTADPDGYLRYIGRQKDIIRRRGENVSPGEVESAILRFAGVAECAVVGVPAELGEDEIMAVLVPEPDATLDLAALDAFLHGDLADFAVPRLAVVVPALPKTITGRVQRHELQALRAQATALKSPMTATTKD